MKIIAAAIHEYRLPLRARWLTTGGGFSERQGCLLRLESENGARGYGDCAPLPKSGQASTAAPGSVLAAQVQELIGLPADQALLAIDSAHGGCPAAARLAIETALLDLASQFAGQPLAHYLGSAAERAGGCRIPSSVAVNAALGSVEQVDDAAVRAACSEHFTVLKLKVGMAAVDLELKRLRQIAERLPAGVRLRLDANRAWSHSDAERFLRGCVDLPIEMIEEPLAQPTLQRLQAVQAATAIAIAIDESAELLPIEQVLRTPQVRRLVIKPMRLGGLRSALLLARRAAEVGLECIVTSSVESACGVTAAAHLAAAIDNRLTHGLATSAWLAADTGWPPTIVDGRLLLPRAAGLGFTPAEETGFTPVGRRSPG